MSDCEEPKGARDPGDAVPPGVAVERPAPLTDTDRKVRDKLDHLGEDPEHRDPPR